MTGVFSGELEDFLVVVHRQAGENNESGDAEDEVESGVVQKDVDEGDDNDGDKTDETNLADTSEVDGAGATDDGEDEEKQAAAEKNSSDRTELVNEEKVTKSQAVENRIADKTSESSVGGELSPGSAESDD